MKNEIIMRIIYEFWLKVDRRGWNRHGPSSLVMTSDPGCANNRREERKEDKGRI